MKPERHVWEDDSTHRAVAGKEYDEVWDYAEQLEAENRQLRRIIEVNAPDVDIEYNLSQLNLSLSEIKEKYLPNRDIDDLRKKPETPLSDVPITP